MSKSDQIAEGRNQGLDLARRIVAQAQQDGADPHDRAVIWNLICLWWTHENIAEVDDERVDV